jgi:hypothetical protein
MALIAINNEYVRLREPCKELLDRNADKLRKSRNDVYYVEEFTKNKDWYTCRLKIDKTGDIFNLKTVKSIMNSGACCAGLMLRVEADGETEYDSFKSALSFCHQLLKENKNTVRFADVSYAENMGKLSPKFKSDFEFYVNRKLVDVAKTLKLGDTDKIRVRVSMDTVRSTGKQFFKTEFYVIKNRINEVNGTPAFYIIEAVSGSSAITQEQYVTERKSNRSFFEKVADHFKKPVPVLPDETKLEMVKMAFDNSLAIAQTETTKESYGELDFHIRDEKVFTHVDYATIDNDPSVLWGDDGVSNNSYNSEDPVE